MNQKSTQIKGWAGSGYDSEVVVFPLGDYAEEVPALSGRVTLAISTGCATLHLRPTAAETRALIDMLEWSLAVQPAAAVASLDRRREQMVSQLEAGCAAGVKA